MKIVYVYDALCGWCYGFSPTMERFVEKYNDHLKVEVISGGMVVGNRIGPIGEVAGYISRAYKDVEKATGVKFGSNFLNNTLKEGTAIFTSVPPAIALCVFKSIRPDSQLAFASQLQKAIYFEGMKPEEYDAYGKLAGEFGISPDEFVIDMKEDQYLQAAEQEFRLSQTLGVSGFPTVFLSANDEMYLLARGAAKFDQLEQQFLRAREHLSL